MSNSPERLNKSLALSGVRINIERLALRVFSLSTNVNMFILLSGMFLHNVI